MSLIYLGILLAACLSLISNQAAASSSKGTISATQDAKGQEKTRSNTGQDLVSADSKSTKAVVLVTTKMLKDDKFSAVPRPASMDLFTAAGHKKYVLVKKKPKMKKIKMEVYKPKMKYKKIKMKVPVKKMKKKKVKGYMVKKHHEHY